MVDNEAYSRKYNNNPYNFQLKHVMWPVCCLLRLLTKWRPAGVCLSKGVRFWQQRLCCLLLFCPLSKVLIMSGAVRPRIRCYDIHTGYDDLSLSLKALCRGPSGNFTRHVVVIRKGKKTLSLDLDEWINLIETSPCVLQAKRKLQVMWASQWKGPVHCRLINSWIWHHFNQTTDYNIMAAAADYGIIDDGRTAGTPDYDLRHRGLYMQVTLYDNAPMVHIREKVWVVRPGLSQPGTSSGGRSASRKKALPWRPMNGSAYSKWVTRWKGRAAASRTILAIWVTGAGDASFKCSMTIGESMSETIGIAEVTERWIPPGSGWPWVSGHSSDSDSSPFSSRRTWRHWPSKWPARKRAKMRRIENWRKEWSAFGNADQQGSECSDKKMRYFFVY